MTDDVEKARRRGHREAAQDQAPLNPYNLETEPAEYNAWDVAAAEVVQRRLSGLDPGGHQPTMPSTCVRSALKVCNCCSSCRTECNAEGRPAQPSGGAPTNMLGRAAWALIRIAISLEKLAFGFNASCGFCGSMIGRRKDGTCIVCGSL